MRDQWLIRTSRNVISGPFTRQELCEILQQEDLGPQDEICQNGSYWVALYEREEIFQQLGIQLPKFFADEDEDEDEEETQTQIETALLGAASKRGPEIPELAEAVEENTAVLSNRALRNFQPRKKQASILDSGLSSSLSIEKKSIRTVEKVAIFKGLIWVLVLITVGFVFWMIYVLKGAGSG